MKDYRTTPIDSRDLTARLNRISKADSSPNDGDYVSRLPGISRAGTTSSDTSSNFMPTFRKSHTASTTDTMGSEVSRLEVMRTVPMAATQRESVEVAQEGISKPRIRKRRASHESGKSAKSVPEFQYYGRHANTWLFNDFSITNSVKKGWGKVFSGESDEQE